MSYTIKEINSANSYNLYIAVGVCDPILGQDVENAWLSAFNCTDILYFADKDEGISIVNACHRISLNVLQKNCQY